MEKMVSIIIPCRNEEKFIGGCLNSLLSQDYPKENLEILVIDGMSEDRTREIVEKFKIQNSTLRLRSGLMASKAEPSKFKIQLLDNPKKLTPFGLNIGIKEAKGDIIARMDAHALYENKYISKCVKYLNEYKVDNVGGIMVTIPRSDTILGKVIVAVLSHPFGVGNAVFRLGAQKPILVDTVFGGCYRKEIFQKIGYFNEKLPRGQDMEFNLRLRKFGGKILLAPEIKSFYYARSDLKSFFIHSFTDGVELISPLKFGVKIFSWRHLAPLAFILSLIMSALLTFFSLKFIWLFFIFLVLYFLINLYFSVKIYVAKNDFRYLFLAPIVFAALHFAYGAGSVYGLLRIFGSKNTWLNFKNILNSD